MGINKNLIIVLAIIFLTCICSEGLAFLGRSGGEFPDRDKAIEGISKKLELSKEQEKEFRSRSKEIEKDIVKLRLKNRDLWDKVESELLKDKPDRGAIYKHMQQINQNQFELRFKRMDNLLEFRKKLSPEQQKKFKDMLEQRKKRAVEVRKKVRDRIKEQRKNQKH